jgi:hypothetical protein
MIGQNLVMHEEKCLPAIVVRIIVKIIFVVIPCSLIFVCNQTDIMIMYLGLASIACAHSLYRSYSPLQRK